MNNFVERYKIPKLTQAETNNLNSPIHITEVEFIVKNPSENKILGQVGFSGYHMDESQMCYGLSRGSQTQKTTYTTFWKRKNYVGGKLGKSFQGARGVGRLDQKGAWSKWGQ